MAPKRKAASTEEAKPGDGPSTSGGVDPSKSYWLMKSEPSEFSWDDLAVAINKTSSWEGVRNPQARNNMRAMSLDDEVFFYHSNCKTPMIVGIAKVVRTAYPDHSAWDKSSKYYDASSTPEKPKWWMVDVQLVRELSQPVSLETIKRTAAGNPQDVPPAKKKQKKGGSVPEESEPAKGAAGVASNSVLSSMELLNRSRLSVQRVTPEQWQAILAIEAGLNV